MKTLEEQLQPGEEIVYVAQPTKIAIYASLFGLVAVLFVTAVVWDMTGQIYVLLIGGLATLPLIFTAIRRWIFLAANQFVLTNRRVLRQTGIVSKQSVTSYLDKINNVEYRQSFWGRILNYGDVEVDTASETGTTIFRSISSPVAFQRAILEASEKYRTSRGGFAAAAPASGADRLRDLKRLLDDGLISQTEYEAKRAEMLKAL